MDSKNTNQIIGLIFIILSVLVLIFYVKSNTNEKNNINKQAYKPPAYDIGLDSLEDFDQEELKDQEKDNFKPPFNGDLGKLIMEGRKNNKKSFAVFSAQGCSWCVRFKEVLSDPTVSEYLENYVVGEIKYQNNVEDVKKIGIKGFPTIAIFDREGNIFKIKEGYLNNKSLINFLK